MKKSKKQRNPHKVQIIIALIGLVGVLGAALIANWDKIFQKSLPTKISKGQSYFSESNKTNQSASVSKPHKVIQESIPFIASNKETKFAVKGEFTGVAVIDINKIIVDVSSAVIFYPSPPPSGETSVFIEYVRVSLAKYLNGGGWEEFRKSPKYPVSAIVNIGNQLYLPPFQVDIPIDGIQSLGGYWLVFDIAIKNKKEYINPGFSHAHTRFDLF